jgi:hypothetical protein
MRRRRQLVSDLRGSARYPAAKLPDPGMPRQIQLLRDRSTELAFAYDTDEGAREGCRCSESYQQGMSESPSLPSLGPESPQSASCCCPPPTIHTGANEKGPMTKGELELAKKSLEALRYELEPSIWADVEKNLRPLFLLAEAHVGRDDAVRKFNFEDDE